MTIHPSLALFLLATVGVQTVASAQERTSPAPPTVRTLRLASCPTCRIELIRHRSIGDANEELSSWPTSVAIASDGRVLVAQPNTGEPAKIFAPDNQLLSVVGRAGEGPGEYRDATLAFFDAADSIIVVDQLLGRLSVFDTRGGFGRSFRVPISTFQVLRFAGGEFVFNAHQAKPTEVGLPLRVHTSDGAFRLAFGSEKPEYDVMHPANQLRHLTQGGRDAVWSAPRGRRYVIEQWGLDGRLRIRFERDVDWFRPYDEMKDIGPSNAPQPRILGIWSIADSLVGVLVRVPDRRWQSGLGPTKKFEGYEIAEIRDPDLVFDTIVELIDVSSARVRFSTRLDRALAGIAAPAMPFSVQKRADGFSVVHLYRVELRK